MTIQYDNLNTQISSVGSAANIPIVFQTKGTGALDFSAGSTGINISNGNTVTAVTLTSAGSNYTSAPTVAISAPQIAGGTTATATIPIMVASATVSNGGTGYTLNDVLTVQGGTSTVACQLTVTGVTGGVITSVSTGGSSRGQYTVAPSNPVSVTGGTGSGATFTLNFSVANNTSFTITNAGSGYVEQPTVTFSGGGGSGAAAYATVGGGTIIRSLGSTGNQSLDFYTPSSITSSTPVLRLRDVANIDTYPMIYAPATTTTAMVAQGSANASIFFSANGTGSVRLTTNGTGLTEQFRVSHTASAVNYVQVTGAATINTPVISAQGSDTNVNIAMVSKGTGFIRFFTNGVVSEQFRVLHTAGTIVNYAAVTGSITNTAPAFSVAGSDTNIDLALTPKGTGLVRFGTRTATSDVAITGYLEIKDSGGTTRKLAIID